MGLNVPAYFMPSLTSIDHDHIDCDYQIVDNAGVLYASLNSFYGEFEECAKSRKMLEKIAKLHNLDLREYRTPDEVESIDVKSDRFHYDMIRMNHGINSIISDGLFLTAAIHSDERRYLEDKGMKVEIMPLGDVSPGAGLKCVYGEFNL
jgi:hypothetical protein